MKVLFAIKALDGISGGAERVLADITSGLSNTQKYHVSILTFDTAGGSTFYPINKKIERICLGIGNTKSNSTLWESITRIITMRKIIKQHRPDVVVAFMHSMFVPLSISLIGTGIPVIGSEHIIPTHYKKRWKEFFLFMLSSYFIKKITVLSEEIKNTYPSIIQKKMIPISNPVTFPKRINLNTTHKKRKTILNVGRLDPQKNQALLIEAFSQLANQYSDWDLKIIGEGLLREQLEAQISNLGLNNRIFLPGTTSDISAEYVDADIFALPSSYESFGLATAEALAHGLPAVGFANCEGTNKLIEHTKNGLLVSGNQPYEFTLALEHLMTHKNLREKYGIYAPKSVQKFSINSVILEWEKLLTSLNKIS
tara:strand:- start:658 stop:1761 length:1104 start_codon:yes stop_codon:yes gene_type:complete